MSATTEIYTLSLHDALPISRQALPVRSDSIRGQELQAGAFSFRFRCARRSARRDRKSTRLNSSHVRISYAVFCLKKKKIIQQTNNSQLDSHIQQAQLILHIT